ncbi:leucine-rich repeat receptor-like protein kinase PXC1 isoform X1 [Lactuca sativa]|uniref:leucine-rich repeat receptor-like protein kinase PXC1 isoform X1 n=1 Tax=Lactuca sativa TaxID=4236 RepID=UPI000CD85D31|nr:leucine-rich repeat receptor-like protein kinase PXC1 isoform X1 [Lactuca sativa]
MMMLSCLTVVFALSVSDVTGRGSKEWRASAPAPPPGFNEENGKGTTDHHHHQQHGVLWSELVIVIALVVMLGFVVNVVIIRLLKEKTKVKNTSTPVVGTKTSSPVSVSVKEVVKVEDTNPDPGLVFFVEQEEQFNLQSLLDAGADLQNQNYCSSLYKVQLNNNNNNFAYAVKRLKKLQAPCEEFDRTMAMVGKLNHQNILPLVAYSCQGEEKLLIYKYQNKGSLLALMERHIEGKIEFPWKVRLSIAVGIARGLDHIYKSDPGIPHGNIKLSNILLNENKEALISEYGYWNMVDPKSASLQRSSNGYGSYTAPEKCSSEKGDVFSFGVILLELLTGKIVENSYSGGLDLPKWVKAMVREEWTGEVFDKEIAKVGMYAFPLLNVSLKCVAHFAENRPSMAEVLETILGVVVEAQEEFSFSSTDSTPPHPHTHDAAHVLYSVAEDKEEG